MVRLCVHSEPCAICFVASNVDFPGLRRCRCVRGMSGKELDAPYSVLDGLADSARQYGLRVGRQWDLIGVHDLLFWLYDDVSTDDHTPSRVRDEATGAHGGYARYTSFVRRVTSAVCDWVQWVNGIAEASVEPMLAGNLLGGDLEGGNGKRVEILDFYIEPLIQVYSEESTSSGCESDAEPIHPGNLLLVARPSRKKQVYQVLSNAVSQEGLPVTAVYIGNGPSILFVELSGTYVQLHNADIALRQTLSSELAARNLRLYEVYSIYTTPSLRTRNRGTDGPPQELDEDAIRRAEFVDTSLSECEAVAACTLIRVRPGTASDVARHLVQIAERVGLPGELPSRDPENVGGPPVLHLPAWRQGRMQLAFTVTGGHLLPRLFALLECVNTWPQVEDTATLLHFPVRE